MSFRVGHGFDAHAFESGKPLVLGGVFIKYPFGLKAYSDGDVVIHALCDAVLGALALGDIGKHFPNTNIQLKNCDSTQLLSDVYQMMAKQSYQLVNADLTIVAQVPKLSPYVDQMRNKLADVLLVSPTQISAKATTTEGMGFEGRKEGISAHAVVLIERQL